MTAQTSVAAPLGLRHRLNEYYELCKPRVVMLIVFTAIIGMFLAVPGLPPLDKLLWGTIGITLQAAAAAAVNQLIDRNIDARMARTCGRPLVTGTLSVTESVVFTAVIGIAGFAVLYILVNPLTTWLTLATLIGYAGVYTLYLKRATPCRTSTSAAAGGAAPPVLGWIRHQRHHPSACAAAVPDHLRLDAAAFLGAGRSSAATNTRRPTSRCCR